MTGANKPFRDLLNSAQVTEIHGDADTVVTGIHYDSRQIEPGALFVALRGGYADGHEFLDDAIARGAVAALLEQQPPPDSNLKTWALVADTRKELSPLSATFYDHPGSALGVIGITGTDGKTTTSYLVDAMLRANGLRTGLIGTVAIRVAGEVVEHDTRQTTPESLEIQRLLAEMKLAHVDWAVIEATSHALTLPRLDDCPFDIAVVTNITREHLDFHGSIEAYREAKAELLRRTNRRNARTFPAGAVINADDEGALSIAPAAGDLPVTWFSLHDKSAHVFAHSVELHGNGIRFKLRVDGVETAVDLRLLGSYNVFNALAAAGVGRVLGLKLEQIRAGLESLSHVPGRLEPVDAGQPFKVIVDYAHSPASLRETLTLLRNLTAGRVIAVFGSAGERDRGKRAVQGAVSAELADVSIFTSEDPRFEDPEQIIEEIATGAIGAGAVRDESFFCIERRRDAILKAIRIARPGDTVLLAGKGHERCIIYGDQRVPWDEVAEANAALRSHGYHRAISGTEGTS